MLHTVRLNNIDFSVQGHICLCACVCAQIVLVHLPLEPLVALHGRGLGGALGATVEVQCVASYVEDEALSLDFGPLQLPVLCPAVTKDV